jgi:hypothetical protein
VKLFEILNDDTYFLYASHCYDNPQCESVEEFYEDLDRIKYVKRLFTRYDDGELKERLILNHLIIIHNVFGIEGGLKLVFHKIGRKHWSYLKTFLVYLNYLGDDALPEVPYDEGIQSALDKI